MRVAAVNYAINVWAMKRAMNVAQSQVSALVQSMAKAKANPEFPKGTLIDVRV